MPASPCPEDADVLSTCVRASLARYFQDLGEGAAPRDLWQMVMGCTERALLQAVMAHAANNQTRAAEMLGITRNTLRKKLLAHQLAHPLSSS